MLEFFKDNRKQQAVYRFQVMKSLKDTDEEAWEIDVARTASNAVHSILVEHDWLWLFCHPVFQLQLYICSAAIVPCFSCYGTSSSSVFCHLFYVYIEALVPYRIDRVLILDRPVRQLLIISQGRFSIRTTASNIGLRRKICMDYGSWLLLRRNGRLRCWYRSSAANSFPWVTEAFLRLLLLAKKEPDCFSDPSKEEITDKSNADGLTKTIVCFQALRFLRAMHI